MGAKNLQTLILNIITVREILDFEICKKLTIFSAFASNLYKASKSVFNVIHLSFLCDKYHLDFLVKIDSSNDKSWSLLPFNETSAAEYLTHSAKI